MDPYVQKVTVWHIIHLRQRILRPGKPIDRAFFVEDSFSTTWHMGIYDKDQLPLLGCATYIETEFEGTSAWQLRGMATTESVRGLGYGKILLTRSEERITATSPIRLFWCNARLAVVEFYKKMGWETISEPFETEGVGPHIKMVRRLT